jgi:PAS domain S-box-containing protein
MVAKVDVAEIFSEMRARTGLIASVVASLTLLAAAVTAFLYRQAHAAEIIRFNAYNRSLIEASLDPLVTISVEGKITDVNAATEQVTGCARGELIGADFSSYFTAPEQARAGYQQVFSAGFVRDYPLAIRHTSGRVTEVLYNASIYKDEQGRVLGVFAAARDITERKRDEELHEQIARVMRHDLRTPACNAINIARMLREEASLTEAQRHNLLCLFEQSGQNMLDTLNGSLDLYKIETGQYQLEPETFDCLAMVLEISGASTTSAWAADRRQEVLLSGQLPGPDSRCLCLGRPELLRTVLQNLLRNALEASPPGAAVVVDVSSDKDCRIEIRNKGVVPVEMRERFFDKYATLGKASGTGLGTYSAKMMVEAQGGGISMRTSDENNETVVTLRLPC